MLSRLLFEALWFPCALAALGLVLLLFVGRRMEHARRGRLWIAWMLLTAGLFLLQKAVVTDREEIRAALGRLIQAVESEDTRAIGELIASDYSDETFDREALMSWVEGQLQQVRVDDTIVIRWDASVSDDRAELRFRAFAAIDHAQVGAGRASGEWLLRWKRDATGWRITSMRPVEFDGHAVDSWDDLRP